MYDSDIPSGMAWLSPVFKYVGHFHVDPTQESPDLLDQIAENLRICLERRVAEEEWDVPPQLWFAEQKASSAGPASHAEANDDCPLKDDPDLWRFDPMVILEFGNVHPIELFETLPPAPEGAGVMLCAEGWQLLSEKLDTEEAQRVINEHVSLADHPMAEEVKQIVYCSPDGEMIMLNYGRDSKEYTVDVFRNSDPEDKGLSGGVPGAMRKFVQKDTSTMNWSETVAHSLAKGES